MFNKNNVEIFNVFSVIIVILQGFPSVKTGGVISSIVCRPGCASSEEPANLVNAPGSSLPQIVVSGDNSGQIPTVTQPTSLSSGSRSRSRTPDQNFYRSRPESGDFSVMDFARNSGNSFGQISSSQLPIRSSSVSRSIRGRSSSRSRTPDRVHHLSRPELDDFAMVDFSATGTTVTSRNCLPPPPPPPSYLRNQNNYQRYYK